MENKIVLNIESADFNESHNISIKDIKGNSYEIKEDNKLFTDYGTKQEFVRLLTNIEEDSIESNLYLPF